MTTTAELALVLPAPEFSVEEIEALIAVLREGAASALPEARGWLTAKEIAARMAEGTTDRAVRKLASAACPQVVSFPGSPGYKLWQLCTVEEINHCIGAFESQGKDMLKRAVLYRQAYHRRFRGAPS